MHLMEFSFLKLLMEYYLLKHLMEFLYDHYHDNYYSYRLLDLGHLKVTEEKIEVSQIL